MQKVTMNVVAEYAGVSKKTVSRVLNDEPNVSAKTKQKVKLAFEALSYKPNLLARGLATNRSYLIALIYDNPNKSYVDEVQTGALKVCDKEGYHLVIHPTAFDNDDLLENLQNFITQSQLDGLVLTPPFSDMQPLLKILDEQAIPYVRISPTTDHKNAASIITNDEEASYEITQYLISLGHESIAFIKGHPDHNVSEQRFNGYKRALADNGIAFNKEMIEQGYFDFNSGEQCAKTLLELEHLPTAIFASNDSMAAAVLKVANQKNILIPEQLSVTGFDDASISRHIWPSLTTIQQPIRLMTTKALEVLLCLIRNKQIEERPLKFNSKLVIRESSAAINKQVNYVTDLEKVYIR